MDDIAIGRKEIMHTLHVQDWQTVRNWRRNYNLPVKYMPNGKPMIFIPEVIRWIKAYDKLRDK